MGNVYFITDCKNIKIGYTKQKNVYKRLKQIQKEYQMIESTSKKILDISNDIKQISQRQNQKIDDISQNIFSIEQAAFDTNKEVQTLKDSTRNSTSKYCWIALGLFVSLIILILMTVVRICSSGASINMRQII